jgi:hypothetical protein
MKYRVLAALALVIINGLGSAADRPNFAGDWKMNPTKSNYGPFPPPVSVSRNISLTPADLTIVDDQQGGGGAGKTTRKYTLDGKTSTFEINGASLVGTAARDGEAIIVTTSIESAGVSFKDRMSLSADGNELTSKVQVSSGQGDAELSIVFDRQ